MRQILSYLSVNSVFIYLLPGEYRFIVSFIFCLLFLPFFSKPIGKFEWRLIITVGIISFVPMVRWILYKDVNLTERLYNTVGIYIMLVPLIWLGSNGKVNDKLLRYFLVLLFSVGLVSVGLSYLFGLGLAYTNTQGVTTRYFGFVPDSYSSVYALMTIYGLYKRNIWFFLGIILMYLAQAKAAIFLTLIAVILVIIYDSKSYVKWIGRLLLIAMVPFFPFG